MSSGCLGTCRPQPGKTSSKPAASADEKSDHRPRTSCRIGMAERAGPQAAEPADGGFKGFERCLPENCVEYMLFIIDTKLQPQHVHSRLDAVRKAAVQLSGRLTGDYIWQRDAFNVEITNQRGARHTTSRLLQAPSR